MRVLFFLFSVLVASLLLLPLTVASPGRENAMSDAVFSVSSETETASLPDSDAPQTEEVTETAASAAPVPETEAPEPVFLALSAAGGEQTAPKEQPCAKEQPSTEEQPSFKEFPSVREPSSFDKRIMTVTLGGTEKQISLHDYLVGAVLGELPAYFSKEAKKAQAVAARTYLLYREAHGFALTGDGAVCTAYLSPEDAEERLGSCAESAIEEAEEAVSSTDGEVLCYDGDIACTMYHAMSWQYTEDASHIFPNALPYLISVPSPEDASLAGMTTAVSFSAEELKRLLSIDTVFPVKIKENPSGRAESVTFGETAFDGGEVRRLLGLRSTAVTIETQNEDSVTLTVRGYGHGVGMSQQGAQAMAISGSTHREILAHYYPGTTLVRMENET